LSAKRVGEIAKSCLAGLVVFGVVAPSLGGCGDKALQEAKVAAERAQEEAVAAAHAECAPVKTELAAAQRELATTKTSLASVLEENTTLKQTPSFLFELAGSKMSNSSTDIDDLSAIDGYKAVIDRFPRDALAVKAQRKIAELNGRIEGRAKALEKAQAGARRLIQESLRSLSTTVSVPDSAVDPAPAAVQKTSLTRDERIERALSSCDTYVREVRRRRAEMLRLQRSGSPDFPAAYERNTAWLERQESGSFGRALEELRQIMESLSDTGARGRLARDTARRCQP